MTITFERQEGAQVVRMPARLVLANASSVRAEIIGRIEAGDTRLVFDLSGVQFADSSGLSAVLACVTAARRAGGDVVLTSPTPRVQALIELTRLDDVISVMNDIPLAIGRVCSSATL